jgi:hypothetical protein
MSTVSAGMEQISQSLQAATESLIGSLLAALKAHPEYAKFRELDLRHSALRNVRRAVTRPKRAATRS